MYKRTIWKDHVEGIQEGTDLNAANFNNLEAGTMEANALAAMNAEYQRHANDIAKDNETIVITATLMQGENTSIAIPANATRNTLAYRVIPVITSSPNSTVDGYVLAFGNQANGFKAVYKGAATAVSVSFYVSGGMI